MIRILMAAIMATNLVVFASCGSVYCFALVTPSTSEPPLLAAQHLLNVGIFQCDGWDIISNVSAEVLLRGHWEAVDGVRNNYGIVDTELFVKQVRGPPGFDPSSPHEILHTSAKHLANTPVFQKVWDKVFELGKWQNYDWTIKLDVDAVPLPLRLHDYLKNRPQKKLAFDPCIPGVKLPYKAEYLFNARHDMYGNFLHGPAEAVSQGAMQIFGRGRGRCKEAFPPMDFGEDFYLNKCLELLGIPSVKAAEVPLLYDTYEWGEFAKKTCGAQTMKGEFRSMNFAVYHAHKTVTEWLDCYAQAKSGPAISEEMRRLAIEEAKRRPAPRPATITTTTRTITTTTRTSWTTTTPAASMHTTVVIALADAQSTQKVAKHAWMFRIVGQLWPFVALLVAGFVAVPFYGFRCSEAANRRCSGCSRTESSMSGCSRTESSMSLVDHSGNFTKA